MLASTEFNGNVNIWSLQNLNSEEQAQLRQADEEESKAAMEESDEEEDSVSSALSGRVALVRGPNG